MTEPTADARFEWILHVDLDAFFASVEQLENPDLAGKPVIVGSRSRRGVVATASYEARAYGVRSAMPAFQAAKLCPEAIWVAPRHDLYRQYSERVQGIFRSFVDSGEVSLFEMVSVDEAYLATSPLTADEVAELVSRLRSRIRSEVGLASSAGASTTKLVSKLASDAAKPDGQLIVGPSEVDGFLTPLPAAAIPGVGPVTQKKLSALGVGTIQDLRSTPAELLASTLGSRRAAELVDLAWGRDPRRVEPPSDPSSLSAEETFDEDVTSLEAAKSHLRAIAQRVTERVGATPYVPRTVVIKMKTSDHKVHTRQVTPPSLTVDQIPDIAAGLITEADVASGLRLLGVAAANLFAPPPSGGDALPGAQLDLPFED